jgi:hypothetical protein
MLVLGCVTGAISATSQSAQVPKPNLKKGISRPIVSPSRYGFITPIPAPTLPATMDVFTPPLLGDSNSSGIAEWTRTGQPDETITLAGPDFTSSTRFRFYGQTKPDNAVTVERMAHVADTIAASVVLPTQLPAWSMYLVWPKVGATYGKPIAVNRTDAWWIGSDQALPGETISLHGRNLAHKNGTALSWIYIKTTGKTAGQWLKPTSVNPYRVNFKVPTLPAGQYEVWAHNGHGGHFGWSGPLSLTILAQSPWASQSANRFNVKDYGAAGDGMADDTRAIQATLNAAANTAPATVYFPAGTYIINGMIEIKNNVSWLGESRDTSFIKAGPAFASGVEPYWQALIYSDSSAVNRVEFKNLTFDGSGNLGKKSLCIFRNHDYVKLTNSRFNWKGAIGGFNIGSSDYLTITGCEFIGDQVFLADSKQVVVSNNNFRLTDYANAAIISWGGSEVAVSNNQAQDYDPLAKAIGEVGAGRFFVSQSHPDSNRHFYIGDNTTRDMAPPVNIGDANQGEQILFEIGTSILSAAPLSTTSTTATFESTVPIAKSQDAIIIKGRGTGQFRRVVAVNGNTITVAPAWSVVPDKSSVIGVGPAQTRSVVYRNRLDGKSDYAKYETASVAMSMYGNVSDVVFAHNRVTDMRSGLVDEYSQVPNPITPTPSALYFNLITNNSLDGAYRGMRIVTNFLTEKSEGTWGHLGNTYRRNTLKNITLQGIHFGADQGGFKGADLNQNVFEHNTFTNVPTAIWVGKATAWMNNPVNTRFNNLILYKNIFNRGMAAVAASKAMDIPSGTTSSWRFSNTWTGFETGAKDNDKLPSATVIK